MNDWLLRLFPGDFRARYGDELRELAAHSRHPWLDRADLVLAAVGLRAGTTVLWVALVGAAVAVVAFTAATAHSVANLAGGVSDVPRHWWSTFAVLGLAAAVATTALAAAARHRAARLSRITG